MLSFRQDDLLLSLCPAEQFRPIPAARNRRAWEAVPPSHRARLRALADQALESPIAPLTASMYLRRDPYLDPYRARRECIRALALGVCVTGDARYTCALADLLWAVTEESSWVLPDAAGSLRFGEGIDLAAAETAADLALCQALLSDELQSVSPLITRRVSLELSRRVFAPLAGEQSGSYLFSGRERIRAADALMSAVLFSEQNDQSRWLCMRKLLQWLEKSFALMPADGGFRSGLERRLPDVFALSNCLFMISMASGGEVELRDEPDFARIAEIPCLTHIGAGWFLNPGGDSPRPNMDPDSLYRLGDGARSGELCALAAFLARSDNPGNAARPASPPLMHQMLTALYKSGFSGESSRSAPRLSALLPQTQVAGARVGEWYAALIGGTAAPGEGHSDIGDLVLFYKGDPVIISPGGDPSAEAHSVPVVGGIEQTRVGTPPREGVDFQYDAGYVLLSLGIEHAYPQTARLQLWQRSLIRTPLDSALRLVDMVEMASDTRKRIDFRFLSPRLPSLEGGALILGDVALTWEDDLTPFIDAYPLVHPGQRALWGNAFYRVTFSTQTDVAGGRFAFQFHGLSDGSPAQP